MNIKILYETYMDDLKAVKDYVNKKDNVISDIEMLKELLKTEHVEKSQIVFYVQVLFNSSMKTKHHKIFIKHIYNYVSENISDFRQYLLLLKIIKIVIVKENLLMSDLLVKMLTKVLKVETKKSLNRNFENNNR
ncbi:hypothetical protein A0H76_1979 [Hepatospora eriocheir]|uniref:Uncharacterized protein n=1 Tax=Hepatospora eriocheir TaxID=1081669 RepID=A0A1X0QLF4_9MICR|nr:hypothetical protein A0H76_1979 [Hepatospora eriocheir]